MKKIPPELYKRTLTVQEWRSLGIQQSYGWEHYTWHKPEKHILLFRRPLGTVCIWQYELFDVIPDPDKHTFFLHIYFLAESSDWRSGSGSSSSDERGIREKCDHGVLPHGHWWCLVVLALVAIEDWLYVYLGSCYTSIEKWPEREDTVLIVFISQRCSCVGTLYRVLLRPVICSSVITWFAICQNIYLKYATKLPVKLPLSPIKSILYINQDLYTIRIIPRTNTGQTSHATLPW